MVPGLLDLGLEAPVMTPNGVLFLFSSEVLYLTWTPGSSPSFCMNVLHAGLFC